MSEARSRGTEPGSLCRWVESVAAYVQGELSGEELSRFEGHLSECSACRREASEFSDTLDRLRGLPAEPNVRDLAPEILARIPETEWRSPAAARSPSRRRWLWRPVAGALAASVLIGLSVGWILLARQPDAREAARAALAARAPSTAPPPSASVPAEVIDALEWLASSQEPDGSWDPEKWSGQGRYTVGLSGLALLAFLSTSETPSFEHHFRTVDHGLEYLVRQQGASGRFGPLFGGAIYNHGIAAVTLLEAYALTGDRDLRDPIGRALDFMCRHQDEAGGWGYLNTAGSSNTSVTAWQLHALLLAGSLGWPEAGARARKGLAWMHTIIDKNGLAGYRRRGDYPNGPEALTAMAAFCASLDASERWSPRLERRNMARLLLRFAANPAEEVDYYRWYFLAHALHAVGGHDPAGVPRRDHPAAGLRRTLVQSQLTTGPESGSWTPSDRWSLAGGRVYATATAVLTLEADQRASRLMAWTAGLD